MLHLLYTTVEAETWTQVKKQERMINGAEMWIYRKVGQIRKMNKCTSTRTPPGAM